MQQISVIVPVYNTEQYLDKCINSILSQTYSNLEIILVDDGSTDSSLEICKRFSKRDKRVRVFHKENGGQGSARNLGLNYANGDLIGFVDSDDFIHPRYYEILSKLLDDTDSDIVCCHYQFIQTDEEEVFDQVDYEKILKSSEKIDTSEFLNDFDKHFRAVSWISPCTKLYKKEIFDGVRYLEGVIDEDSYILHHALGKSTKMCRVEEKLYYYVWSSNSTSRSDFSVKRFDKNGANLDRIEYFHNKGITKQEEFFKREYLIDTLKMYYLVKNEYPKFLNDYKRYVNEYKKKIFKYMNNNRFVCNMEKLIYILFAVSPKIAEPLFNKYLK